MLRIIVIELLLSIAMLGQTQIDLSRQVKGILPVNNGGTGTTNPNAFSLSPGQLSIKYSIDYNWTRSPSDNLGTPGPNIVTFASCPFGVFGTWPGSIGYPDPRLYYVYVSGTGTAEAVVVTGGTCNGDGKAGTLTFTTANAHPAGYTVSSASAGIIEASNAAAVTIVSGNNFSYRMQEGRIVVSPGLWPIYAPVSFINNEQTFEFDGAVLCMMNDDCLRIGDLTKYQASNNITLLHPSGVPGVPNNTHAFIVDFANSSRIYNVTSVVPQGTSSPLCAGNCTFGYGVEIVGDQHATVDGVRFDTIRCDATFCGAKIYAPGPFSGHAGTPYTGGDNAAVGYISHLESGNCSGNGVDWQSGNTLRISDSVIQAYSQFAVRFSMVSGGFGSLQMDNVYNEAGCSNPLGNVGNAGLILIGGRGFLRGGESPSGGIPLFANQGGTTNYYYVVAQANGLGASNLLYAGTAALNNTGNVNVVFNKIPGATSYDLLATTTANQAPFGTGNWAVATAQDPATICTNTVCTIVDNQTRSSYTVQQVNFAPAIPMWPGGVVLSNSAVGSSVASTAQLTIDYNDFNFIALTETNTGSYSPNVAMVPVLTSTRCMPTIGSPVWQSCLGNEGAVTATLLSNGVAGIGANLKGRLNFMSGAGSGTGHMITIFDSNLAKTLATGNGRPTNDPNDTYIGWDSYGGPGAIGLTIGAPVSITNYIGNAGDGVNWQERLTNKFKILKVPLQLPNGSANHAVCFKSDGTTLGSCSTAPAADGSCTCN